MKKINLFLTIILLFLFTNCIESLDVTPESIITAQSMWTDEEDAASGVAGMLNSFRTAFNEDYRYIFWFELRSGIWDWGTIGEDSSTEGWQTLMDNDLDASSSPGTNWEYVYTTINSANLAIKYIPGIDFSSEDDRNFLLAQAYFVRAYCYFVLARVYGDVPVLTSGFESADDENLFPERDPVADVITQVKSDIETGVSICPESETSRIKPTKAALNMLKAEVYLWSAKRMDGGSSDLESALTAVNAVISNSNYELLSSYEDVFSIDNEENDEVIFSIYSDQLEYASDYFTVVMMYSLSDVPTEYQNDPVLIGGAHRLRLSETFIDDFLKRDTRDTRKDAIYGELATDVKDYIWINKYSGEWENETRYLTSNTIIYRYAEALLFKAEILNAQEKPTEAVGYLNEVAKRAYGVEEYYSSSLSTDEVDDAILDERLIEFAVEGKSWFDIIRFGQEFERISSLVGREDAKSGNVLLFPIAPETITQNTNIAQTEGYE